MQMGTKKKKTTLLYNLISQLFIINHKLSPLTQKEFVRMVCWISTAECVCLCFQKMLLSLLNENPQCIR